MLSLRSFHKTFLTGLVALLPIMATVYLFFWVIGAAETLCGPILKFVIPEQWYRPGMGLFTGLAMIFLVGILMESILIKGFVSRFEEIIYRVPLVKSIYGAVREFLSFLLEGKSRGPRQVVAVELFAGMTLVGFITKRDLSFINSAEVRGKVAVYLPFSYQIGGYTILVSPDQLKPLDIPIEQAMRFVMTAGIIEKETSQGERERYG